MQLEEARVQFVEWLQLTKGLSPHTVRAYGGDVAALQRYLGAGFDVRRLSQPSIEAVIKGQRASGLSEASMIRRIAGIRGFLSWLVTSGLVPSHAVPRISLRYRRPRRLPRPVPRTELNRLLVHLRRSAGLTGEEERVALSRPHETTTLIAVGLMLSAGVRVGEVVGIHCAHLDIKDASVRVMGKGSRERTVYFPDRWLQSLLSAYLLSRKELAIEHPYLLFKRDGTPMTSPAIRGRLAQASRAAGLVQTVTPHMLRHSAATELIASGVDIRYVQRLLGHASITTTELYTHVSDSMLRRAIAQAQVLESCFAMDN